MKIVDNGSALADTVSGNFSNCAVALKTIDKLHFANHLIKASILASSSFEDSDQRDAFTALMICTEEKITSCVDDLRTYFVNANGV